MTLYVIIIFIAILIGMATSVFAFGTGGKRKKIFQDIYFSIENVDGIGIIYTKTGEYSAVLRLHNPVPKYCADIDQYYDYTKLFSSLTQTLGEGYALHKQDIFVRRPFKEEGAVNKEYLSASYFNYYRGREYTDSFTYLTITQENKKGKLFSYDNKKWKDFIIKIHKVQDQLKDSGVWSKFLDKETASEYADRFFAMNFRDKTYSMTGFNVTDEYIGMGNSTSKIYSLVDVDCISMPANLKPYTDIEVNNTSMPVDIVGMIDSIPGAESVVFNQIIYVPGQKRELSLLEKKKNRHASIPNPSNQMAVEDIKKVQEVLARENRQLVYTHFNLIVTVPKGHDIQKCTNYLENQFSRLGIHISKRAYNQLEVFVNSFPGNCYGMSTDYDRFLAISEAASCLMYKETPQKSEDTPLKIYYTDRQGVPIAIDVSGKEGKNKITDNSNFFVLGPSGSGKSFFTNSVMRQMWEQNTDVVMVDTGNSYEGLCEYVGGKYISYTEEKPITMNPFAIKREELNIEKVGFLKNLIMLIWKGTKGVITKTEDRLIEQVIMEYFTTYFRDEGTDRCRVPNLSFNTFYEYSVERMPKIITENNLTGIDLAAYNYLLKDFYKGGNHELTLNEQLDTRLFDETFIVFEIDSIKDDPLLFPLVTLIICDTFLQKMRLKKNRKVLVIEEAWKAIASPMMAEYIRYIILNYRLLRARTQ